MSKLFLTYIHSYTSLKDTKEEILADKARVVVAWIAIFDRILSIAIDDEELATYI